MTTLRSATSGVPAWMNGPAIRSRTASTVDPPPAAEGTPALPNRVRRNGIRRTKVKPSSTDEIIVATMVATNSGV